MPRLPQLLNEVHDLISRHGDRYRFAMSGSSSRKLRRLDVNLLAGRAIERRMFPFTSGELGGDFDLKKALAQGSLPPVVERLVAVLRRLARAGHAVVVIEHHADVILGADWVVDLGPEGGEAGGRLLPEGPKRGLLDAADRSHTGRCLRDHLASVGRRSRQVELEADPA